MLKVAYKIIKISGFGLKVLRELEGRVPFEKLVRCLERGTDLKLGFSIVRF